MKSRIYRREKYLTRQKKRCVICGRSRRITWFGVCQIDLRELSNELFIPGLKKSPR